MIESIYLILLFFIVWFEICRKKSYKIDFLTLFHIYYALLYPLPGFVLAIDYQNAVSPLGLRVATYSNNIQTSVAVVIGYFVILFGFYSKLAINFGKNIIINARKNDSIFIDYVIFLLVIGALSIYIYGLQYGGVLIAIAQNSMIRARAVEGGNLVFFSRLTMYSVFSSYLLCSLVFIKKHKKISILGIALFLISLVAAIIAVLFTGSRAAFVFYFLNYYYVYLIRCKRIPWLSSITLLCCACLFLFYGKSLFYSLSAITQGVDAALDLASNALEDNQEWELEFFDEHLRAIKVQGWCMYFNGVVNSKRAGVGVILVTPEGEMIPMAKKLEFEVTYNQVEYKAYIFGLEALRHIGAEEVTVFGDLMLVVKQVSKEWEVKEDRLRLYVNYLAIVTLSFNQCKFIHLLGRIIKLLIL